MPILREVISASARPDSVVVSDEVESAAESGIRCLSSWIQHGVGIGMEESVHLVEPLLAAAGREALAEAALDAITHLVNLPEAPRFPNILMAILGQLLQLQDLLQSLKSVFLTGSAKSSNIDHIVLDLTGLQLVLLRSLYKWLYSTTQLIGQAGILD